MTPLKKTLVLLLACAASLQTANATETNSAGMHFWWDRPTNPDNGESVYTAGALTEAQIKDNRITVAIDFSKKTPEFEDLGGWMAGIISARGMVPFLGSPKKTQSTYFGMTAGFIEVTFKSGETQTFAATCLQQGKLVTRLNTCYLNGFDSINFNVTGKTEDTALTAEF